MLKEISQKSIEGNETQKEEINQLKNKLNISTHQIKEMEDRIKEIFQENFKLNEANHQLKLNYILDKQSDLKKDDLSDSNTKMYNKISIVFHSFSELIIKLFGLYQKETNKSYFNKESSNRNLCILN